MDKEEQKLVGYIIYTIMTFKTKGPQDTEWKPIVASPTVEWKKKIYLTEANAKEAAKHIEENQFDNRKAVIVPIYANRIDLDMVRETWKKTEEEVKRINNE